MRDLRLTTKQLLLTTVMRAAGKAVLLNNIMKMYNSPLHSDVSILVEESRIAAHRQVLATHSKVFQRMWEHDLQEVRFSFHSNSDSRCWKQALCAACM